MLFPPTRITRSLPLPTVTSLAIEDGKFHIEFDIEIAAYLGRAVLSSDDFGVELVKKIGECMAFATKDLLNTTAFAATLQPKGSA